MDESTEIPTRARIHKNTIGQVETASFTPWLPNMDESTEAKFVMAFWEYAARIFDHCIEMVEKKCGDREIFGRYCPASLKRLMRHLSSFKSNREKVIRELEKAAYELFYCYEYQITRAVENSEKNLDLISEDAVSRCMHFLCHKDENLELEAKMFTRGVIYGRSGLYVDDDSLSFPKYTQGHALEMNEAVDWNTSDLFEKPGIVEQGRAPNEPLYLVKKKNKSGGQEYGFRRTFEGEEVKRKLYKECQPDERSKMQDASVSSFIRLKNEGVKFELKEQQTPFEGRAKELQQIHEHLKKGAIVALTGPSGVGKSELALKYAHSAKYCKHVIWLDASSEDILQDSFKMLVENNPIVFGKRIVQNYSSNVYQALNDDETLFVFDNAMDLKEIRSFLPLTTTKRSPYHYFLITSCQKVWKSKRESMGTVEIKELCPIDAVKFAKKILKIDNNAQDREIELLVRVLEYSPQAIKLASSAILSEGFSKNIQNYCTKYATDPVLLLTNDEKNKGEVMKSYGQIMKVLNKIETTNGGSELKVKEILNNLLNVNHFRDQNNTHDSLTDIIDMLESYSIISIHEGTLRMSIGVRAVLSSLLHNDTTKNAESISKMKAQYREKEKEFVGIHDSKGDKVDGVYSGSVRIYSDICVGIKLG